MPATPCLAGLGHILTTLGLAMPYHALLALPYTTGTYRTQQGRATLHKATPALPDQTEPDNTKPSRTTLALQDSVLPCHAEPCLPGPAEPIRDLLRCADPRLLCHT